MRVHVQLSVEIEASSLYEGCERIARAVGMTGAMLRSITADEAEPAPPLREIRGGRA